MANASNSRDRDLVDTLRARLNQNIESAIAQLIKADASQHDKLAGRIQGLREASTDLDRIARDWFLGGFDEEAA